MLDRQPLNVGWAAAITLVLVASVWLGFFTYWRVLMTDVVAGQILVNFTSVADAMSNIKAGKVRVLAVSRDPSRAIGSSSCITASGLLRASLRVICSPQLGTAASSTGKVIGPGKDNPLGTRWMGLDKKGYGIHGTNEPRSIGKAASHGCIRMARKDLEQLFELVRVGDVVEIIGERDEAVAQIFAEPAQPTVVASVQTGMIAGQN